MVVAGESLFRVHWTCWKYLGQVPTEKYTALYYIYSIVLNFVVTFGYPLHLMIGLFNSETQYDMFKNLAINLTCVGCSIKTIIIWSKLNKVRKIDQIVKKLDGRIQTKDEALYYKRKVFPAVKRILHLFYFLCLGTALTSEVSVVITGFVSEWRLMYPAYFPFDPYASSFNYIVAHLYQFLGVSIQILQNLTNDTYGAMSLAMLSGHVQLLGMRVTKIGYDPSKSTEENNTALMECVQDHRDLLDFHVVIEDIISLCMFVQIIFAVVNMCVVIIFMIFYVQDAFSFVYYTVYLFAMPMEIFPCCYFGSYLEFEFEMLTHSIFSCNWMDQSRKFKQNLLIFSEQSLRKMNVMAGEIFRIHLDTFFATCKGAYSLFTVVMSMK